jgi:hypothetical protein
VLAGRCTESANAIQASDQPGGGALWYNSDAPSKMNHNITTDEVKADHAKPASTSSAVLVTMRGNDTQQKQDKEQQPLTNDNGSELLDQRSCHC